MRPLNLWQDLSANAVSLPFFLQIPSVVPYNVDDLKAVVAKNTAMRQREMIEAEGLLHEESDSFTGWRESLSAIPTINQLQERANMFRQEELTKCTRKLSQNDKMGNPGVCK